MHYEALLAANGKTLAKKLSRSRVTSRLSDRQNRYYTTNCRQSRRRRHVRIDSTPSKRRRPSGMAAGSAIAAARGSSIQIPPVLSSAPSASTTAARPRPPSLVLPARRPRCATARYNFAEDALPPGKTVVANENTRAADLNNGCGALMTLGDSNRARDIEPRPVAATR